MAQSPSHKFGQIIGNLLEDVIRPLLEDFCQSRHLYLDHQRNPRPARRGKKVTWKDSYGNKHDLDYVIEREATDDAIGQPLAFIEVAWRRYTRHSRNKAQEIQGAILPIADKYKYNNPFLGVVLAGDFTTGSIEQMQSLGFHILYYPYQQLVDAFAVNNIDVRFDDTTPDDEFRRYVQILEQASESLLQQVAVSLIASNQENVQKFFSALALRLERFVEKVILTPLYGRTNEFATIAGALDFINQHPIYEGSGEFKKYEVYVTFSNGDKVEGSFRAKTQVKDFLEFIARQ